MRKPREQKQGPTQDAPQGRREPTIEELGERRAALREELAKLDTAIKTKLDELRDQARAAAAILRRPRTKKTAPPPQEMDPIPVPEEGS